MVNEDLNDQVVIGLTITQCYTNEMAFRLMMRTIGVDMRERNKIISDGFKSLSTIVSHHKNDVKGFETYLSTLNKTFASASTEELRVYFSPVIIARFVGVVHYFNQSVNSFHTIPDQLYFDADDTAEYASNYRDFRTRFKKNEDTDDEIKIPLLLGSTNWIDFRDKFITKLSATIGTRDIPLDYVIDDTPRRVNRATATMDEVSILDIDDDNVFRTLTVHFGTAFKKDNQAVWLLLKKHLLGIPSYNHISRFDTTKNGKSAWKTLKDFFEGEDFRERMRESAFAKLSGTFYKGETARFSFEKYVQVHKAAHKMLEDAEYGENGMDNATKIQHFKQGIKIEAGLETALTQVRANPIYKDFDQLISFLTAEVEHNNLRRKQLGHNKDRSISGLEHDSQKGRKGHPNNDPKQQNRNRPSRVVDGTKVYARRYSREDFGRLTPSQRTAVVELCREARKNRNRNNQPDKPPGVSAAKITELREDMVSMGDAIIAGVQRATGDNISIITPDEPETSPTGTKRNQAASSGSVGEFIKNRRTRRK
jgi:hypothetical protein